MTILRGCSQHRSSAQVFRLFCCVVSCCMCHNLYWLHAVRDQIVHAEQCWCWDIVAFLLSLEALASHWSKDQGANIRILYKVSSKTSVVSTSIIFDNLALRCIEFWILSWDWILRPACAPWHPLHLFRKCQCIVEGWLGLWCCFGDLVVSCVQISDVSIFLQFVSFSHKNNDSSQYFVFWHILHDFVVADAYRPESCRKGKGRVKEW